jgi:tetratricopeptide (TPR) repeat protein
VIAIDEFDEWDVREALGDLVAKSMIADDEAGDGTTRYRLLETLREFALDRARDLDDIDELRRRHAHYYAAFVEAARPGLLGADELAWLARFDAEGDNLRGAVNWALAQHDRADVELAIRIVGVFPHTALSLDQFGAWSDRLVDRLDLAEPGLRCDVLCTAALWNALVRVDIDRARTLAIDALRDGPPPDARGACVAYSVLAIISVMEGQPDEALKWLAVGHEACDNQPLDPCAVCATATTAAVFAGSAGHYELARTEAERALTDARRNGQPTMIAMALFANGVAFEPADPAGALEAFEEAVDMFRKRPDRGEIGMALAGIARLRLALGNRKGALAAARDGVAHYHYFGLAAQVLGLINETIVALTETGQTELAAVLTGIVASGHIATLTMTFKPERMAAVEDRLQDDLGPGRYLAAVRRGQDMAGDDAVAFVLSELDGLIADLPDASIRESGPP